MRLPFVLPEFTRVQWASAAARDVWAPRVQRIGAAWSVIERLAIGRYFFNDHITSVRRVCRQQVAPDQLPALTEWCALNELMVLPMAVVGQAANYAAGPVTREIGKPWAYDVAILHTTGEQGRAWYVRRQWIEAWKRGDNDAIGELLGYPSCCREFFARTWGAGQVDTTWDMTAASGARECVQGPAACNILLRWLGVRLVSHLPCAFTCEPTAFIGQSHAAIGRQAGYETEMDWLEEMLEWPVLWSALHGIAEIVTPVCKISTRTDATAERHEIRREGARYPSEGATGLSFPFRRATAALKWIRNREALCTSAS